MSQRLASVLLLLAVAAPSYAQEQEGSAEYQAAIRAAVAEHDRGAFDEARALFLRAHAIQPSARTLRALGIVAYELRDHPAAVRYLSQALDDPRQPLDEALRAQTRELLALADAQVGRFRVQLRPEGATLRVDGEPPLLEADGSVLVGVGRHRLEASLEGHEPARREIEARGGERRTIELSLQPVERSQPVPQPELSPRPELTLPVEPSESHDGVSSWVWWVLGAALVAVAVGVGVGVAVAVGTAGTRPPYEGTEGVVMTLTRVP